MPEQDDGHWRIKPDWRMAVLGGGIAGLAALAADQGLWLVIWVTFCWSWVCWWAMYYERNK